jgi:hypothetical protein
LLHCQNCLLDPEVFWWNLWGLLSIESYHLEMDIIWLLPCLFESPLIHYLALLLLLKILILYWIRLGRVDTLILLLNLEEMILVFPHLVWCWP